MTFSDDDHDDDDDDDQAARHRLGTQVLWYRRDRLASRLKLLAVAQLLLCGWFAVGPRTVPSGRFGGLCGCGVLVGLWAAQTCSRSLLLAHALLCCAVACCAALLLRAIAAVLPTDAARQPSSHSLLLNYGGLTLVLLLLQLLSIRVCISLLCLPASWRSSAEGSTLLPISEELEDLDLDVEPAATVSTRNDIVVEVRPRVLKRDS